MDNINDIIHELERQWSIMNNEFHRPHVRMASEGEYIRLCQDGRNVDEYRVMPYIKQYILWKTEKRK